ncbi:MAG TPA: isocitrate lyase/phosphoenolpyruvate mutase family protein [Gaiellaceae bacterium]|nr:isocitrate lyase/phosphoenolpyruvate mutase family protein [Gaiellaceae bacterium]
MDDRADAFRQMHSEAPILVLPNAWDVASAKRFAALPGCRALATTSAAVARCLGYADGEQTPVSEMIEACRRIAAAVDLPVTADLERGYGDWVATARAAWDAGLVGMNFEDSANGELVPAEEQVAAIREIKAAVPGLVLNARVDVFLVGGDDVDEAVRRANAYLEAGADCTYPYSESFEPVPELAKRIDGPINVVLEKGMPHPRELQQHGVARATWGARLAANAYAEAERIAVDGLDV